MPLPEINDCNGVAAAVRQYEAGDKRSELKRYIIHKAVEFGCTEHIPDSWEVEMHHDG